MERRVFATLLACTLFTIAFFWLSPKPARPPAKGTEQPAATATPDVRPGNAAGDAAGNAAGDAPATGAIPDGEFAETEVGPIAIEPYENPFVRVELTNRGAAVRQVWLKGFPRTVEDRAVERPGVAQWVSVLPEEPAEHPRTLGVRELTGSGRPERYALDRAHWQVASDERDGAGRTVVFRFETRDGLVFEKTLRFHDDRYAIDVELALTARSEDPERPRVTLLVRAADGIQDVQRGQWTIEPAAAAGLVDDFGEAEVVVRHAGDLAEDPVDLNPGRQAIAWAGCSNLYFAALLAPVEKQTVTGVALRAAKDDPTTLGAELLVPLAMPRPDGRSAVAFTWFAGPKDPTLLKDQGLAAMVPLIEEDYGSWESFRWINKVLLAGLRFFKGLLGNYGFAIILLTLLMRIAMFPITRTQQVSMQRYSAKMAVLKPKLDELKERYKNNPQKLSQEQFKLMREHGTRPPVVGCLSSLITVPVFIGMFQILRSSIELRQAPFLLWVEDLSLPDSLFVVPGLGIDFNVLPILATGAFLGQMLMAPKPADPQMQQQQKIMLFMPIVFGVMFYNYAAGLSLYMLTSSAYGMFEYKFIRQRFFPSPPAPVASA